MYVCMYVYCKLESVNSIVAIVVVVVVVVVVICMYTVNSKVYPKLVKKGERRNFVVCIQASSTVARVLVERDRK